MIFKILFKSKIPSKLHIFELEMSHSFQINIKHQSILQLIPSFFENYNFYSAKITSKFTKLRPISQGFFQEDWFQGYEIKD